MKKKVLAIILTPIMIAVLTVGFYAAEKFSLIKRTPVQLIATVLNGTPKCENEELRPQLSRLLRKKMFSVSAERSICESVNEIDKYYDNIYTAFGDTGIPDKNGFCEKFLTGLENTTDINFFGGRLGERIYEERIGTAPAIFDTEKNEINYGCPPLKKGEFNTTIPHEIVHGIHLYPYNTGIMLCNTFVEGYAAFWSETTTCNGSGLEGGVDLSGEKTVYHMGSFNTAEYGPYFKAYADMLMAAGYDACEEYIDTGDTDVLSRAIKQKTKIDTGSFLSAIHTIDHYEENSTGAIVDALKTIEKCIIDNIFAVRLEQAQSVEELKALFNYYRFNRIFVMAQHYTNGISDSEKVFDIADFENELFERLYEAGVFAPLSGDKIEQRKIYNALLLKGIKQDSFVSIAANLSGNQILYKDNKLLILGEGSTDYMVLKMGKGCLTYESLDPDEDCSSFASLTF